MKDSIADGVKVVKPPDLIFLHFDDDNKPEAFYVDKIDNRDVLYLRLDLIKETLRRLHHYGNAAMFNDDELRPLWDVLATLNIRERQQRAREVDDGQ